MPGSLDVPRPTLRTFVLGSLLLAAGLLVPGRAGAADAYRLGDAVRPSFQSVQLRLDADADDYSGSTVIEVDVRQATREIRLHAEEMQLQQVTLTSKAGAAIPVTHAVGEHAILTLTAAQQLAPGAYTIRIDFTNDFGTKAVGLYRMEQDGQGYAFTQFEADDAREAFPCFDEPSFKQPWQLTIEVPEAHTAVTNTPVDKESVENGWRRIAFARSKPLPTYLVAIASGRLEKVPIPGLGVPGNVVTIKGQSHLAGLAVETTPPILKALEQYFDSSYPYEKLDLIAIPEYWPGAMENPGAITYAARILLVDPKVASVVQKRTLASVTAHELAHMWFGDVVTMKWWDDLWLNEAFADWMGDKITQHVYPQYNLELNELQSVMDVMVGDARPSAQAIRRRVEATGNLMENIGTQYNKGKGVLAMFEQWIGTETFRQGVLKHIEANAWGNATGDDFWAALASVSRQDFPAAMATFIEQPGVPLVSVELTSGNQVRLQQQRFANFGVEQPAQHTWKIPVAIKYSEAGKIHVQSVLLEEKTQTVTLDARGRPDWILPNADQRGYYRWSASDEIVADLARNAGQVMNERERVGFIGNLSALLDAGEISGDEYLFALGEFADDPQPAVVAALVSALGKVRLAFVPLELRESFALYVQRTLGPALERFGMQSKPGEDESVAIFRPQLLRWLGDEGRDAVILEQCEDMARSYMLDPSSIDPSLAGVALDLAAFRGNRELFDEYKTRFETAKVPADRNRYLSGLGSFRDPALVQEALVYATTGPLRANELFSIPRSIMSNPTNTDMMWQWFTQHYDFFAGRLPETSMGFMPFMASGCSAERLEAAKVFFAEPEHKAPGTETNLAKVGDAVRDCVSLREREGAAVASYLNTMVGER
jgi:alanyl aminopeptidase